jgi:hypothetical protein
MYDGEEKEEENKTSSVDERELKINVCVCGV